MALLRWTAVEVMAWMVIRYRMFYVCNYLSMTQSVAYFTKEVNQRLAKRPLETNGRLANRWLTSLVKEATGLSPSTLSRRRMMN